jgi:probable rRNA maturation factor
MAASREKIVVVNRQRPVRVDVEALQEFAVRAYDACLPLARGGSGQLATLERVDVILISDHRIAQIHRQFMQVPGPTDVITFHHGEIFISADTAKKQAKLFRTTFERELRLYILHGLLHLQGFEDKTKPAAAEMNRIQDKLLASL